MPPSPSTLESSSCTSWGASISSMVDTSVLQDGGNDGGIGIAHDGAFDLIGRTGGGERLFGHVEGQADNGHAVLDGWLAERPGPPLQGQETGDPEGLADDAQLTDTVGDAEFQDAAEDHSGCMAAVVVLPPIRDHEDARP